MEGIKCYNLKLKMDIMDLKSKYSVLYNLFLFYFFLNSIAGGIIFEPKTEFKTID